MFLGGASGTPACRPEPDKVPLSAVRPGDQRAVTRPDGPGRALENLIDRSKTPQE